MVMFLPGGFAPGPPTRSLARRFAGSLRSRGSFAGARSPGRASPLGLPYTLPRSPLRRLAPFAWLVRCARSRRRGALAPRTPLHALSLAASPARSVRVARSLRSFALPRASPLGLPYTLTRSPLRSARSVRVARSLRSFASCRGASPLGLPYTLSRSAASPPRSVRVARSLRSFASVRRAASPLGLPYTLSRSALRRLAPFAWLARCARSRLTASSFALGLPYTLSRSALRRLAPFAWLIRCARSPGRIPWTPYTLSRSPLRRLAPFAWLIRWRSFARPNPSDSPCIFRSIRSRTRQPVTPLVSTPSCSLGAASADRRSELGTVDRSPTRNRKAERVPSMDRAKGVP